LRVSFNGPFEIVSMPTALDNGQRSPRKLLRAEPPRDEQPGAVRCRGFSSSLS
jgi:hypothetical protein